MKTPRPAYDADWKTWTDWADLRLGDELDANVELGKWTESDGCSCARCETAIGPVVHEDPDDCSTWATWTLAFAAADGPVCEDCMIAIDDADMVSSAERYIPQVGDRVRLTAMQPHEFLDITYVGIGVVVGINERKKETTWWLDSVWIKLPDPVTYPEQWLNVYLNWSEARSRADADRKADRERSRIAVIHLAADGTLTLHPVERES